MIVYGYDQVFARWAGERLGVNDWGLCKTMAVYRRGELAAIAVFNQYRHPNIEISFVTYTPRWATREAVSAILRYPFIQIGCKRVTATTEATNQPARAFLCRLGFREEGFHPDALPTGDAVTYGLLARDAARWLVGEEVGQEFTSSTA